MQDSYRTIVEMKQVASYAGSLLQLSLFFALYRLVELGHQVDHSIAIFRSD